MKYVLLALLLLPATSVLYAQDRLQYAVTLIPDSLKKNVNAVIREESHNLVIKSPGKGSEVIKKVITVLNEKGDAGLVFAEYPDKFKKIDDVEINIYDEAGKYSRRFKRRDLEKVADDDGFSLVSDDKILYAIIRADKYPLTVEYNYTIRYSGFLEYRDFYPKFPSLSIQQSAYTITTSSDNRIRYKNYRCTDKPVITESGNNITYSWSVKNVDGYIREAGSAQRDIPRVLISPSLFEMDDYDGDMSTWDSYGKWQISLNNQINQLPESSAIFYRNLVKDAKTDKEKIAILYKHLQENYRYVSIQLGIGGWKPFPAEFVEKKKYGDCKALSNFMYAMLKAVNIRSHYAIINAGYDDLPVDREFPQNAFNHVILCVPQATDTIWLECTSRKKPFGKLGNFTENRNAFLITDNGGVVVSTPISKAEDNVMKTVSHINLLEDGSGNASVDIDHQGEFSDMTDYVVEADDQHKKSYIINESGFKQPDDLKVSKKNIEGSSYSLHYDMQFEKIPDFNAGSKLFLSGRLYKFWNKALPKSEKRQNDYYLEFPLIQSDSTIYQLPDGFIAETIPKPATIKYALGSFQTNYVFDAEKHQLITTCTIKINKHIIPASRYQEAAQFFSDVIKEQQQKIVVRKE